MIHVTKENFWEVCDQIRPLRASAEPVPGGVHSDIRECVGNDCCRLSKVFIGSILVENDDREKKLHACQCCNQVFVDDDQRPVQGTFEDYLKNLHHKHGDFTIILGSKAARMGVTLAHQ